MRLSAFTLFISLILFTASVQAQTGILSGTIIDSETKETLIGATVRIANTPLGAISDFNGLYTIRNIEPGKYSATVSYTGYQDLTISDIEIKANEKTELDIVMSISSFEFNEVTIIEYRKTNTVSAVLQEVRAAKQVVVGISSQQIFKSQDNNAAQVVQRVPGVTIVENRFVMIRGLSERYNNVMVNNTTAPSTEIDRRTFSFDLISSSALDRMMIYKSGSADLPGDFAGGVIKVFTVSDVEKNYTRINVGVGYRAGTTGNPYFQSEGSATDFLGFDNGYRLLPNDFPSTRNLQNSARNAQLRKDASDLLPNNFNPIERTATPDYSFGINFGRNLKWGERKLTTINAINYSTSYQYFQRDFFRYFEWVDRSAPIDKRFEFIDNVYEKQNRVSIMSNWRLQLNDRSSISFKNLFNQVGENETILRNGFDFIQRPNDDLRNYLLGYRSRSIYLGQFEGNHELNDRQKLHWVLGGNFLRELEPDLRRFRTYRPQDQTDQNFIMQLPPSSNLFETGRYYGQLFEVSGTHGLDYTVNLAEDTEVKKTLLKSGYYVDYRYRDFSSRYMSYLYPGFFNPTEGDRLSRLPLDQIFAPENIRTFDGFVIEEGTRPIDAYNASSLTTSAYAGIEVPLSRLDLSTGLRGEFNNQRINSRNDFEIIEVRNPIFSILPFLNAGYKLGEKSVARLAYGRTVNRPEFRELAPFLFYDYKLEAGRVGNPDLKPATIENVDLRLELYPRLGETFAIGGFYKYFNRPIENRTIITTEQPSFTYINAEFAQNYGIEVEFRKSFQGVTASPFIDRFSVNTNASLIWSSVDLGDVSAQDSIRPLQGQSPYIVNFALYYEDQNRGLNGSLVYNIFGDRIFSVGDVIFPTIYELSRHSLDLTFSKKAGERSTFKLGIQNLLNAPFRFFQDSDRNEKIDLDTDDPIFTFRRGQLVSFTYAYDLNK